MSKISGIGLGLRKNFMEEFAKRMPSEVEWIEISPENYIERGGHIGRLFDQIAEKYPVVAHGLMLSLGSSDPLNWDYLKKLKKFIKDYDIPWFSDHLCWSSTDNHYFHD